VRYGTANKIKFLHLEFLPDVRKSAHNAVYAARAWLLSRRSAHSAFPGTKRSSGLDAPVSRRARQAKKQHLRPCRRVCYNFLMLIKIISNSERETENAGAALAKILAHGDIVALRGGLGAGKTAFTRGLARGLGITARVTSPTFTIVNEYSGGRLELFHFDMYRISADELFELGWDDYLARNGVIAAEWSENIDSALPSGTTVVDIRHAGDAAREINIFRKET
jgi:tRNA threonylcarbamoyladenosine biosynthesis protein TsaE